MPRFFFHLRQGAVRETDPLGLEFPTLAHAILDAQMAAREIVAEEVMQGEAIDRQVFEITNEDGVVLEIVAFKSAIRLN